ncbi:MAG: DUF6709 family protein [Oscillospiraceae bacterium]
MTKFIKMLLYFLCVVVIISGLILSIPYIGDFIKIVSKNTITLDETDVSKFDETSFIHGDVHYIIDMVAQDDSKNTIQYYLVPLKSEKYIVIATNDIKTINEFTNIREQTQRYLNDEIDDTTLSTYIEGRLIPIDDGLSQILYDWHRNNGLNVFIYGQVIPYVVYVESWSSIKIITIVGLIMISIGIVAILVLRKVNVRT